jgi:short-subunit dehydrogenase
MGKTILITGATSGIGEESALFFNSKGWNVIATGRNLEKLVALSQKNIKTLKVDITNDEDVENLVNFINGENIIIDVLLNNAGYGQFGSIEVTPMDLIYKQFETNVFGMARMIKKILPILKKNKSSKIINISSIAGTMSFPGGGWYSATKYAVEAISDSLRYEVRKFGIKVIIIEPGPLNSEFFNVINNNIIATNFHDYDHLNRFYYYLKNYTKIPILKFGSSEKMAKKIFKAANCKHPRNRYIFPFSWSILRNLVYLLPSKFIDFMINTIFMSKQSTKG